MASLHLAERADDDATEMTLTDVATQLPGGFVDPESMTATPAPGAPLSSFGPLPPLAPAPPPVPAGRALAQALAEELAAEGDAPALQAGAVVTEDPVDDHDSGTGDSDAERASADDGEEADGFAALASEATDGGIGGSALELRVLRAELLRQRRDIEALRTERSVALQEVMAAASEAREAQQETADWRAVAARAEDRVAALEAELAHYKAFATAGLWTRIAGCPPHVAGSGPA